MDYPIRTPNQLRALITGFRDTAALSQRAFAQKLGITQQAVSAMEREPENMSVERLMKVLAALEVELVLRERRNSALPAASEW